MVGVQDETLLSCHGIQSGFTLFASIAMDFGCECCQQKIDEAIDQKRRAKEAAMPP